MVVTFDVGSAVFGLFIRKSSALLQREGEGLLGLFANLHMTLGLLGRVDRQDANPCCFIWKRD